jgi:hypothetical protein
LAASTAWVAIWSGVIGNASDMVGVWIDPVIAQLMMILFAMVAVSLLPTGASADLLSAAAASRRGL